MPKISACIVAYCDYDEVCAAVRSILHYTPTPDLTLYVVDNASPDGCGKQLDFEFAVDAALGKAAQAPAAEARIAELGWRNDAGRHLCRTCQEA